MSTSGSESGSNNSSFSEGDPAETEQGLMAYQYEPEYTEQELTEMEVSNVSRQREIEENPRQYNTDWCSCSNCTSKPLPSECFCCHEFDLLEVVMDVGECVIEFQTVCLNPVVLSTSYVSFLRYKRHRGRAPDTLTNRCIFFISKFV